MQEFINCKVPCNYNLRSLILLSVDISVSRRVLNNAETMQQRHYRMRKPSKYIEIDISPIFIKQKTNLVNT